MARKSSSKLARAETEPKMHIWLSNSSNSLTYERLFFAHLCDNLSHRHGLRRAIERFPSLTALAALPRLDQPRCFQPTPLIREIYEAWDSLWTLRLDDLVVGPATEEASRFSTREVEIADVVRDGTFGRYLAKPLHELSGFAAAAPSDASVRAATHRELIMGPPRIRGWRIIHGGQANAVADRDIAPR